MMTCGSSYRNLKMLSLSPEHEAMANCDIVTPCHKLAFRILLWNYPASRLRLVVVSRCRSTEISKVVGNACLD